MRNAKGLMVLVLLVCTGCRWLDFAVTVAPLPQPRVGAPVYLEHAVRFGRACRPAMVCELPAQGPSPVSGLCFDDAGWALLAVHASTSELPGKLRRWLLPEGLLASVHDLGPVGLSGAVFDRSGRTLATIGSGSGGVSVWDTSDGHRVSELLSDDKVDAIAISADGRLLLSAGLPMGLCLDSLDPSDPGPKVALGSFTEAGAEAFSRLALDAEGRVWAYATTQGEVTVDNPLERPIAIAWRPRGAVLDLDFDVARRHLAVLRENSLLVCNLGIPFHLKEAGVRLEPSSHGALAFSPSGSLLVIASDRGWELRQVNNLHILARDSSVTATAAAFSRDECLLAIGDDKGVVRVFACSKEEKQ